MGSNQSDRRKIAQFWLSTNQKAGSAHLHIQDDVTSHLFVLDQSEDWKSDHVSWKCKSRDF